MPYYIFYLQVFNHLASEIESVFPCVLLDDIYVIVNHILVKFFFDVHSAGVTHFQSLHTQSAADNGQDLHVLVPAVDYEACVLAARIHRQNVRQEEVHGFDAEVTEQYVSDRLREGSRCHQVLTHYYCLISGVGLEQAIVNYLLLLGRVLVKEVGEELFQFHRELLGVVEGLR